MTVLHTLIIDKLEVVFINCEINKYADIFRYKITYKF